MLINHHDIISDISPNEQRALNRISRDPEIQSEDRELDICFENILSKVFGSLKKDNPLFHWCIDDFHLEKKLITENKITLVGTAFWLKGGKNCKRLKIDIGVRTNPLLYSYKFYTDYGHEKQSLYVAKEIDGWIISDT